MSRHLESVVITDVDGRVQYANPAFERMTGYARADIIGQLAHLLEEGSGDPAQRAKVRVAMRAGQTWQGRMAGTRKDRTSMVLDVIIAPVRDEGGAAAGHIILERDVTQQLAAEEQSRQAQKIDSIGRLAGGVAHDFNNILTAIIGHTDLALLEVPQEGPARTQLEGIQEASNRAATLTRQLLTFARRQTVEPTVVNINVLVANLRRFLSRVIGEDIAVTIEAES